MTLLIPFFLRAKPDEIVVILKAREPALMIIAVGSEQHLFLRSASLVCLFQRESVCLNQHYWQSSWAICSGLLSRGEKDPGKSA